MDNKKVLIFDFDGTIADSGLKVYAIINKILPSFGIKQVEESDIERLRGLSAKEIIKEFNVPIYKIPLIFFKFEEEYQKIAGEFRPISGIPMVLKSLYEKGIKMHIASSSSDEIIKEFIKNNKIDYFDLIKGSNGFLGKKRIIGEILNEGKILPENAIYIGDEIRDIESAKKAGIKVASVTWGFNNKNSLEKYEPDYLLEKPEELFDL
jgi:phosphoglycolate phosphatase